MASRTERKRCKQKTYSIADAPPDEWASIVVSRHQGDRETLRSAYGALTLTGVDREAGTLTLSNSDTVTFANAAQNPFTITTLEVPYPPVVANGDYLFRSPPGPPPALPPVPLERRPAGRRKVATRLAKRAGLKLRGMWADVVYACPAGPLPEHDFWTPLRSLDVKPGEEFFRVTLTKRTPGPRGSTYFEARGEDDDLRKATEKALVALDVAEQSGDGWTVVHKLRRAVVKAYCGVEFRLRGYVQLAPTEVLHHMAITW